MRTVMLIDDDIWALADMRETFHFERYGFEITGEYRSAEEAVRALETKAPDLIVSDICMSAGSGLDLAALCAERYPGTVMILVSGHERFDYAQEAIRQGVFAYLLKPLLDSEVAQTMERLLKQWPSTKAVPKTEAADAPAADSLVGRAMSYIGEHYNVSLPLESVAGALYVNKNYLSDLFSKSLGMTFTQYKNTVRIGHAKELIRKGGLSMTEIAQRTGFDSSSRFSKVFHQIEGISPQQYQKKSADGTAEEQRRTPDDAAAF